MHESNDFCFAVFTGGVGLAAGLFGPKPSRRLHWTMLGGSLLGLGAVFGIVHFGSWDFFRTAALIGAVYLTAIFGVIMLSTWMWKRGR